MTLRTFPTILHPSDELVSADRRVTTNWWDYLDRSSKIAQVLASDVDILATTVDGLSDAILASLLLFPTYHVTTSGSDSNDGLTQAAAFATVQKAVDVTIPGGGCNVLVHDGVYSQKTSVIYYKVVSVIGQGADPLDVIFDDRIAGSGVAGNVFAAQDHCILTLSNLGLAGYANGSNGVLSRQFAIVDLNDVEWTTFPVGNGLVANETSKINVLNPGVFGAMAAWAAVSDLSQLVVSGTTTTNGPVITDFIAAHFKSVVTYTAAQSGAVPTGYSYLGTDSSFKGAAAIPGSLGADPASADVKTY